jgi:ectoine hydroxylase-related dioxygenase (phytanoyl-CoA dioxygenase family)
MNPCAATLPESLARNLTDYREAYARDGVIHVPKALNAAELRIARSLYDWSLANRGQAAWDVELGGPGETVYIDTHNRDARAIYAERLKDSAMAAIAGAVLGAGRLWFLGEQLFAKKGAAGTRATPWHQDSDLPVDRTGALAMWIAFDTLPAECSLQFVRGSHRGPELNPLVAGDGVEQRLLYPDATDMAPFPDIDADRSAFDILSWACEPGDVLLFHTMTIHGGAPVPPSGARDTR